MKIWIVLSESCPDCNCKTITVLTKPPTDVELRDMERSIGGMTCINTEVYKTELGKIVKVVSGKREE